MTPSGDVPGAHDRSAGGLKAAVFDLGGVCIDWDPRHLYQKLFGGDDMAMERFLGEICTPDWNAEQDGSDDDPGRGPGMRRDPSRTPVTHESGRGEGWRLLPCAEGLAARSPWHHDRSPAVRPVNGTVEWKLDDRLA